MNAVPRMPCRVCRERRDGTSLPLVPSRFMVSDVSLQRVWELFWNEGTKDIRHAVQKCRGTTWTAQKVRRAIRRLHGTHLTDQQVFTVHNAANIKAEIEYHHPDVIGTAKGHFKWYPEFRAKCFRALSDIDQAYYVKLAEEWNWNGPTAEMKRKYGLKY